MKIFLSTSTSLRIFLLILSVMVFSGCGGGDDSTPVSSSPLPSTPSPDLPAAVSVSPFSQQQCEAFSDYRWLNNDCVLAANIHVTNVEYIEALPESDKEDVKQWLIKVGKDLSFEAIFPRWGAELTSTPGENDTLFVDIKALALATENKPYVTVNADEIVTIVELDDSQLNLREHFERSTVSVFIDNQEVVEKEAEIVLDGSLASLTLYGETIYQFDVGEKMVLGAHIRQLSEFEQNGLSEGPSSLMVNGAAQAVMDMQFVNKAVAAYTAISSDVNALVAQHLGFSDGEAGALMTVGKDDQAGASIIEFSSESIAPRLLNTSFPNLYANQAVIEDEIIRPHFADSETNPEDVNLVLYFELGSLSVFGFDEHFISQQASLGYTLNPDGFSWSENGQFEVVDTMISPGPVDLLSEKNWDVAQQFRERHMQIVSSSELWAMQGESRSIHYPAYDQILGPMLSVYSDDVLLNRIISDETALGLVLLKAAPHYELADRSTGIRNLNDWQAVSLALYQSGIDFEAQGLQELRDRIEKISDLTQVHRPLVTSFYGDITSLLLSFIDNVEQENLARYFPLLVELVVNYGYAYSTASINVDEISEAITIAGQEYSEGLLTLLDFAAGLAVLFDNTLLIDQWALDRIADIDLILTSDVKSLIQVHDGLSQDFDLPILRDTFILTREDTTAETIEAKISALVSLANFKAEDTQRISDQFYFDQGFSDITEVAYAEAWDADAFSRLDAVLRYAAPLFGRLSQDCVDDTLSLSEKWRCAESFSSVDERFSIDTNQGYLGVYESADNPYVTKSEVFVEILGLIDDISDHSPLVGSFMLIDLDDALENGLWLSCEPEETGAQVDAVQATLTAYYEGVKEGLSVLDPQIQALQTRYESLLERCSAE